MPYTAILSIQQEPPRLFSQPRVILEIKPSPGGGLSDGTRVELAFKKGDKDGFHSFVGALDKTRERAVAKSHTNPEDEPDLRTCTKCSPFDDL